MLRNIAILCCLGACLAGALPALAAPPTADALLQDLETLAQDPQAQESLRAQATALEAAADTERLALVRALQAYLDARIAASPATAPAPETPPVEVAAATLDAEATDFFETKVRPVLVEQCFTCHNAERQKGGLRLDSREAMLLGGDTGTVLVPGDATASKLIQVLRYDGAIVMPPKQQLPQEQIDAIAHWVSMGAPWPAAAGEIAGAPVKTIEEQVAEAKASHWAFKPIGDPAPPAVQQAGWPTEPMDQFILARLEAQQLQPAPEADKRTLLRRLSFDLTGLPPTPEEMDAFLADGAPGAYARQVDRLLASPHFGERWGRHWLDIARYADTKGYVFQQERDFAFSHTYRDYVVRAFNEDKPYDAFVQEQLAADQLELGDKRDLAAMGFLTLGRNFVGNIHDQIDDKIDVVTRGLLGLTVSCARCHDHKNDPVPAADYYALYGIFRSSVEPPELPLIEEPNPDDPEYQAFQTAVAEKEAEVQRYVTELHLNMLAEARAKAPDYLLAGQEMRDETDAEKLRTLAKDRALLWQLVEVWRDHLKNRAATADSDPIFRPWFDLAAHPGDAFAEAAAQFYAGPLQDPAYRDALNPALVRHLGETAPASLAELAQRYGAALAEADDAWTRLLASASQATARNTESPGFPTQLADPALEALRQVLYAADSPANIPRDNVNPYSDVPTQGQIRDRVNARVRVEATHPGRPDRAMVLNDAAQLFDPYVFLRGKPDNRGDNIPRRLPLLLASEPREAFADSGRRGLAAAIANPANPLTARVWVNRVWGRLFGRFLVDTPSDFGLRASPPTHPELLDHLATRFMREGWSNKQLIRALVLSSTYRQSSMSRPEMIAADPENRLYWRQNRKRLDFEAMRDAVLATAGTLDLAMGGPSVEIADAPYTPRRTVYGRIERQNLPGLFRTFDFAGPDTHAPQRFMTTVPQQALYLMNSPFVIEQVRALAARPVLQEAEDPAAKVERLFRLTLQRSPEDDERALLLQYLATAETTSPALERWQYGYGAYDEAAGTVNFTPFPNFRGGQYAGAGDTLPAPDLGWASLGAGGGHPGSPGMAVVLRWVAPSDGVAAVRGRLEHPGEAGDGVVGHVVAGGETHWSKHVFHEKRSILVEEIELKQGDTIDFVVACGTDQNTDSFGLNPKITFTNAEGMRSEHRASEEFGPPLPPPLAPFEQVAQVLLETNEFLFLD